VGHNVMRNFRKQAKEQKIPFIACKRSVCELKQCLDKSGIKSDQVCNSCWSCTRTTH